MTSAERKQRHKYLHISQTFNFYLIIKGTGVTVVPTNQIGPSGKKKTVDILLICSFEINIVKCALHDHLLPKSNFPHLPTINPSTSLSSVQVAKENSFIQQIKDDQMQGHLTFFKGANKWDKLSSVRLSPTSFSDISLQP